MKILCMLSNESTVWSPSYSYDGVERVFLRAWACSKRCYDDIKNGEKPIRCLDGKVQVVSPWLVCKGEPISIFNK